MQANHSPVPRFWQANFHLSFSSGCPWCAFLTLDEICAPEPMIVLCTTCVCCVDPEKMFRQRARRPPLISLAMHIAWIRVQNCFARLLLSASAAAAKTVKIDLCKIRWNGDVPPDPAAQCFWKNASCLTIRAVIFPSQNNRLIDCSSSSCLSDDGRAFSSCCNVFLHITRCGLFLCL